MSRRALGDVPWIRSACKATGWSRCDLWLHSSHPRTAWSVPALERITERKRQGFVKCTEHIPYWFCSLNCAYSSSELLPFSQGAIQVHLSSPLLSASVRMVACVCVCVCKGALFDIKSLFVFPCSFHFPSVEDLAAALATASSGGC